MASLVGYRSQGGFDSLLWEAASGLYPPVPCQGNEGGDVRAVDWIGITIRLQKILPEMDDKNCTGNFTTRFDRPDGLGLLSARGPGHRFNGMGEAFDGGTV